MNKIINFFMSNKSYIITFGLVLLFIFYLTPLSCRVDLDSSNPLCESIDLISPKIVSCRLIDNSTLSLVFSEKVSLNKLFLDSYNIEENADLRQVDDLYEATIRFDKLKMGNEYELFGFVNDMQGNSLTFELPLRPINENMASLSITEIRPMYKGPTEKNPNDYREEFVELECVKEGNAYGLRLGSVCDGEKLSYDFPSIDVKLGELIVVHLRNPTNAISETSNLNESNTYYSSSALDLWHNNLNSSLNDSNDIVLLTNVYDSSIIDAVPYIKNSEVYTKDILVNSFTMLLENSLWEGNPVNIQGLTNTRSIIKTKKGHDSSCWKISSTNQETPGSR